MIAMVIMLIGSLLVAGGFLAAFLWSVKDGQFEDDYAPSRRILFEDTKQEKANQ